MCGNGGITTVTWISHRYGDEQQPQYHGISWNNVVMGIVSLSLVLPQVNQLVKQSKASARHQLTRLNGAD